MSLLLLVIAVALGDAEQKPKTVCATSGAAATADALATKFDDHQFIFIGSTHGDLKIEEFLMCLVSRPAFSQRATDIVVEWASSGQQRLIDRYILTLEKIPIEDLGPIWFDTDARTLWTTLPQVRKFVETLREVNAALPSEKRHTSCRWQRGHRMVEGARSRRSRTLSVQNQPDAASDH